MRIIIPWIHITIIHLPAASCKLSSINLVIYDFLEYTYPWNSIEIDEGEHFQDNLIKHYHVYIVTIHRNKTRFCREIYNKECWHLFSLRKSLGIPRTTLSSRYLHIFSNEKSALEGAFERGNHYIFFFILMKNYRLSQEKFIDIE